MHCAEAAHRCAVILMSRRGEALFLWVQVVCEVQVQFFPPLKLEQLPHNSDITSRKVPCFVETQV